MHVKYHRNKKLGTRSLDSHAQLASLLDDAIDRVDCTLCIQCIVDGLTWSESTCGLTNREGQGARSPARYSVWILVVVVRVRLNIEPDFKNGIDTSNGLYLGIVV